VRFRGNRDDAHVVLHIDTTQLRLVDSDSTSYSPDILVAGNDTLSRVETYQRITGPNPVTLRASFDQVPLTSDSELTFELKIRASAGDTLLIFPALAGSI
jgi:hypothetical protein